MNWLLELLGLRRGVREVVRLCIEVRESLTEGERQVWTQALDEALQEASRSLALERRVLEAERKARAIKSTAARNEVDYP